MNLGPAEDLAIRSNLNTYPTDAAKVNQAISSGQWDLDLLSFRDAKGFPAVDFLLFQNDLNATWAALVQDADAATRRAFFKGSSR